MKIMYKFLLFASLFSLNLIYTAVAEDGEIIDISSKNSSLSLRGGPPPSLVDSLRTEDVPGPLKDFLEQLADPSSCAATQGSSRSRGVEDKEVWKLDGDSMTTLPGWDTPSPNPVDHNYAVGNAREAVLSSVSSLEEDGLESKKGSISESEKKSSFSSQEESPLRGSRTIRPIKTALPPQ